MELRSNKDDKKFFFLLLILTEYVTINPYIFETANGLNNAHYGQVCNNISKNLYILHLLQQPNP